MSTTDATIDEICVVNLAEAFRGDGEILCNAIGNLPLCAARLARATFETDLAVTDGVSVLAANTMTIGDPNSKPVTEAYVPYRTIFDLVWSGRRHVVMGASQMDMYGNQNFAAIGDYAKPKAQLLGMRGAPGNLINNTTSYWIPNHTSRVFCEKVDVVSGPGYDRMRELPEQSRRFHEIRRVVTPLAVMDFETDDNRMRLRSVHPGHTVEEVVENTGFELVVPEDVGESRVPTPEELALLRDVIDPSGVRKAEFAS